MPVEILEVTAVDNALVHIRQRDGGRYGTGTGITHTDIGHLHIRPALIRYVYVIGLIHTTTAIRISCVDVKPVGSDLPSTRG